MCCKSAAEHGEICAVQMRGADRQGRSGMKIHSHYTRWQNGGMLLAVFVVKKEIPTKRRDTTERESRRVPR